MSARLSGVGLHGGRPATIFLRRVAGPSRFVVGAASVELSAPSVARVDQGVSIAVGDATLDLVEHAAAALGGLGLRSGVAVEVDGGEVPLLDGGAAEITRALGALGVAPSSPRLVVARAWRLEVGASVYAIEPAGEVSLSCDVEFDHPLIGAQRAVFHGDPAEFAREIAPARTFGFARDHAALLARGRARAVPMDAVVVFDDAGLAPGCELAWPDEPARHKLLDLIGDLALYGGPPRGRVSAVRPGHAATHAFVRAALAEGALTRVDWIHPAPC
ncbi:MAG: UDP-3-O-acyl-N-acetylglucosamine deacetylase [Polyangiaceae bacterium]|nr:UDP-3-O-acyl-N-acetylglucosamine deacetylase [Polyangiaceae bacterium]